MENYYSWRIIIRALLRPKMGMYVRRSPLSCHVMRYYKPQWPLATPNSQKRALFSAPRNNSIIASFRVCRSFLSNDNVTTNQIQMQVNIVLWGKNGAFLPVLAESQCIARRGSHFNWINRPQLLTDKWTMVTIISCAVLALRKPQ